MAAQNSLAEHRWCRSDGNRGGHLKMTGSAFTSAPTLFDFGPASWTNREGCYALTGAFVADAARAVPVRVSDF